MNEKLLHFIIITCVISVIITLVKRDDVKDIIRGSLQFFLVLAGLFLCVGLVIGVLPMIF